MTQRFRPYWATIGHGGFLPAELLHIDSLETEARYQSRGWTLTKTKKPYGIARGVSLPASDVKAAVVYPKREDISGLRRLVIPDTHGGYIKGNTWPDSTHHPELLPVLWPGSFPSHRDNRGRKSQGRYHFPIVVDALLSSAASDSGYTTDDLFALGRRKPKATERVAKDLLVLMLAVMDSIGIRREAVMARTGYSKQQLSDLIARGKPLVPAVTAEDVERASTFEFRPRVEPFALRLHPLSTSTPRAGTVPGGEGRFLGSRSRHSPRRRKATRLMTGVCDGAAVMGQTVAPSYPTTGVQVTLEQKLDRLAIKVDKSLQLSTEIAERLRETNPNDQDIAREVEAFIKSAQAAR
jgi:hypothetical protein